MISISDRPEHDPFFISLVQFGIDSAAGDTFHMTVGKSDVGLAAVSARGNIPVAVIRAGNDEFALRFQRRIVNIFPRIGAVCRIDQQRTGARQFELAELRRDFLTFEPVL